MHPRSIRGAGFADVVIRPFATTSDSRPLADFAAQLGPERLVPLLSSGELTLREFAPAAGYWRRFCVSPDGHASRVRFRLICGGCWAAAGISLTFAGFRHRKTQTFCLRRASGAGALPVVPFSRAFGLRLTSPQGPAAA
jgi:hypothetical protein